VGERCGGGGKFARAAAAGEGETHLKETGKRSPAKKGKKRPMGTEGDVSCNRRSSKFVNGRHGDKPTRPKGRLGLNSIMSEKKK